MDSTLRVAILKCLEFLLKFCESATTSDSVYYGIYPYAITFLRMNID